MGLLFLQKNALRRYACLRHFAFVALAGTLGLRPIQSPFFFMLFLGGGLGLFARAKDPGNHMAMGEAAWLGGLLLLSASPFVGTLLMGFGIAATFLALFKLSGYLHPLCAFIKKEAREKDVALANGIGSGVDLLLGFIYSVIIPAFFLICLALILAIVSALRFPLKKMHLDRLVAYQRKPLPALERQLAPYVFLKRKRRHLIWIIRFFVRLFHPGKIMGEEYLPPAGEQGVVYLCNHGYAAATIFSRAWLNEPFRSWSISDLMDPRDAREHIMRYQVGPMAWIPPFAKEFATRVFMKVFLWLFDSIDSIPVYRHRLRELIKTFRDTADALECGDIVMIYPENPDDPSLETPGYVSDRIIPFFSGFTMIGSMYHQQTGCPVTYIPMYCSTQKRRICVGQPIVFDPESDGPQEKERIVSTAYSTMAALRQRIENGLSS